MLTETIKLFDDRETTLTTYIHEESMEMAHAKIKPAMLVIPGGGYKFCSDRESEIVAMQYYAKGYNAFVLRYSIEEKSEFPRPLEDAERAMEIIKNRAEEFSVDVEKIAAIGFSAGGHLAAALGIIGKNKPKAILLGYPCILEDMCGKKLFTSQPSLDDKVDENTPPMFIFAASDDKLVPIANSLKLAEALDKNGILFELHIYSVGGHGFSIAEYSTCGSEERRPVIKVCNTWVELSLKWLDRLFR